MIYFTLSCLFVAYLSEGENLSSIFYSCQIQVFKVIEFWDFSYFVLFASWATCAYFIVVRTWNIHVQILIFYLCSLVFIISYFLFFFLNLSQPINYGKINNSPGLQYCQQQSHLTLNIQIIMIDSPEKSQKQKQIQKRKKVKAFQSFLTKNQSSPGLELIKNSVAEDDQLTQTKANSIQPSNEPVEFQNIQCTVCKIQLDDRKKQCGFCHEPACVQHLRKKRKSKESSKFVKICDKCEDQFLFNKYMKFELKNQQSIAAQQTIIQSKHTQVDMQRKGRKTKLVLLYHKQNQILALKRDHDNKYNQIQNQMRQKLQKIEKKQKELTKLQNQLHKLEEELPPSYQEDYQALELENNKINTQLVKYQKLCNQAIKAKSRREREIYEEYHQWERVERQKMGSKNGKSGKDDDCCIW